MNKKWISGAVALGAATMVMGAAALAQPSGTTTASAAMQATTTAVVTGTAQVTSTIALGTPVVTGTVGTGATATASVQPIVTVVPTIAIPGIIYQAGGKGQFAFAHSAFERVWDRTDHLVKLGQLSRTWFWGPGPNTPGMVEAYKQGVGGMHLVQYFDKSRMEINNPAGNPNDSFFVTNGLLTVDLISGSIQAGDAEFVKYRNACIPMTGDFGDTNAPTYFAFQKVSVSADRKDTHTATDHTGQKITATIDRNGNVGNDPAKANLGDTTITRFEPQTMHNIPKVFWDFLNSSGPIHNSAHQVVREQLMVPWFFVSGYPISEAYWTKAVINGVLTDVMIQAYERRALTYVPSNQPGFQVEMANIGQHYFGWRYGNSGYCAGEPVTTPTPPAPAGTPSPMATGTVQATGTAAATMTAPAGTATMTVMPVATGTVVLATTTVVEAETPTATSTIAPQPLQPTQTPTP